ncbi:acyl-CoA synthetase family protein [Actinokineospora iranica]|uniref:Phenylacetate-coenzyme A ligase PaaK, adenylate-forming domain family n=1 Tax=Actinokineospora iranica TaxID=1271860 RepID=A0A1G6JT68_9PSEU|nr:phenazine antibiotic biosynthesis protein [Actinokineospora iranica]SDC21625.1 Phenylacetate-coenzyme A ligase PaaK, adenylate-forming domain family [Actinokineospora iranica]
MCSAILDLTEDTSSVDPDEYISALMKWHFSAETGSPYWLRRARSLDFDPIVDVRTFADLSLFPNVINEFREVPVEDLIPRGLHGVDREVAGIFESGGTTGAPKRFVMFDRWMDFALGWDEFHYADLGTMNTLAIAPSGPHMFGEFASRRARRHNGVKFTVDLDPRWIKHLIARGDTDEADRYAEHLIDQAAHILTTQSVGILITTPPLLERVARRDDLVELVREHIRFICWSGAHMDADSRDIVKQEIFPGIPLKGLYGSTTILGMSRERPEERPDGLAVFDPPSPYIVFRVVRPETGADVEFGERGQVVMNHLTKYALLPNNLERDTALKVEPLPGALGCAVAHVRPVTTFDDTAVIEGVY